jgi:hypothetical protein
MKGNAGVINARLARALFVFCTPLALSLAFATAAHAAPPANDTRANAQEIRLGDQVSGTTVEATSDADDSAGCGPSDTPSVWYRLDATKDGRAIASLQASGDLDVVLDVYVRQRSQFNSLSCDFSDRRGRASTEWSMKRGRSYLIRISQQQQSVSGNFTLTVDLGQPAARPPGRALPRGGAAGTVQRVFEPSNAWSTHMREGRTYRINLSPQSCMRLSIYGPGTSSFNTRPERVLGCGGYTAFTPGPHEGGRYSLLIEPASSRRTPQRYRLQVSPAGSDDTAPGKFVRNHTRVRGALNANRVDVVDLYRFDVVQNSITDLVLRTAGGADFDLVLVSARGHRIKCSCSSGGDENIHVRTPPGRYFVAVRASRHAAGRYRLTRASKTITRTTLTVSPRAGNPGQSVSLRVGVAPGAGGPVTILVERFDPLTGYQFVRRFETRASGGSAGATFQPPSVGRYRARAIFPGTRIAAGSKSGWVKFRIEAPLTE